MTKPRSSETIYSRILRLKTNRVEKMFKDCLTHCMADIVFAWVFAALPFLIATEVEHLRYVAKNQITNCLPVSANVIKCNINIHCLL